jgi:hypothetical protein
MSALAPGRGVREIAGVAVGVVEPGRAVEPIAGEAVMVGNAASGVGVDFSSEEQASKRTSRRTNVLRTRKESNRAF